METEVQAFHKHCVVCNLQKGKGTVKAPLQPILTSYPLEIVGLDFLTLGRPNDATQNILVATDLFTYFAWAIPTRDQTAQTTVKALWSHIIQPFGCPARFHSDQGPNFESDLVKQLCDTYGIAKSRTAPYHPEGNGNAERLNQTLLNMLRSLEQEKQDRWPNYLPELVHAYNNTPHSTTGYAPSYLMFGRHLRRPVDVDLGVGPQQRRYNVGGWVQEHHDRLTVAYQLARKKANNAASVHKKIYDRKTSVSLLLPGERVWVRDRNRQGRGKLSPYWNPEPYVVLEVFGGSGLVYKVQPERGGREITIHRNSLKVCIAPLWKLRTLVSNLFQRLGN
uniref:Integrase catalytic domain-containing protein n=1 Tax=Oryzias melastigma TaxID=30732 RepID=A0A3B3DC26_ORYME